MGWRSRLFSRSAVSAFVVSSLVSCAIASLFLYPITDAGHAAAWAQAVGVVASIIGAFFIVTYQISHQLEMQKQEWSKRDREAVSKAKMSHDAVVAALSEVVNVMVEVCKLMQGTGEDKIRSKSDLLAVKKQIEIQLSVLESTDLMAEPLVHYAVSAIAIRHEINFLLSIIEEIGSRDEATYLRAIPHRYSEAMEKEIGYLNGYRKEMLDKRASIFN